MLSRNCEVGELMVTTISFSLFLFLCLCLFLTLSVCLRLCLFTWTFALILFGNLRTTLNRHNHQIDRLCGQTDISRSYIHRSLPPNFLRPLSPVRPLLHSLLVLSLASQVSSSLRERGIQFYNNICLCNIYLYISRKKHAEKKRKERY